jgi:hypothetical protein
MMKLCPGVNFINVLQEAFAYSDPKNTKKTDNLTVFLHVGDLCTSVIEPYMTASAKTANITDPNSQRHRPNRLTSTTIHLYGFLRPDSGHFYLRQSICIGSKNQNISYAWNVSLLSSFEP